MRAPIRIWTKAVKTKLCEIGRSRFGCRVYARTNEVDEAYRDGGEWLYDVTWLEYEKRRRAENWLTHPWSLSANGAISRTSSDDFEKLLLAREGRPLDGLRPAPTTSPVPRKIAERLARKGQGVQGLPPRGCLAAGGMGKEC